MFRFFRTFALVITFPIYHSSKWLMSTFLQRWMKTNKEVDGTSSVCMKIFLNIFIENRGWPDHFLSKEMALTLQVAKGARASTVIRCCCVLQTVRVFWYQNCILIVLFYEKIRLYFGYLLKNITFGHGSISNWWYGYHWVIFGEEGSNCMLLNFFRFFNNFWWNLILWL